MFDILHDYCFRSNEFNVGTEKKPCKVTYRYYADYATKEYSTNDKTIYIRKSEDAKNPKAWVKYNKADLVGKEFTQVTNEDDLPFN